MKLVCRLLATKVLQIYLMSYFVKYIAPGYNLKHRYLSVLCTSFKRAQGLLSVTCMNPNKVQLILLEME